MHSQVRGVPAHVLIWTLIACSATICLLQGLLNRNKRTERTPPDHCGKLDEQEAVQEEEEERAEDSEEEMEEGEGEEKDTVSDDKEDEAEEEEEEEVEEEDGKEKDEILRKRKF